MKILDKTVYKLLKLNITSRLLVSALLFVTAIIIFGLCDWVLTKLSTGKVNANYQTIVLISDKNKLVDLKLIEPKSPKVFQNPINGNLLTQKQYQTLLENHPLAMTVNNHVNARHQYGLGQADVVHEMLAEGGITRYVPIFYQNYDLVKAGPIRSLRYYMIELASGYGDALILHHGIAAFANRPGEVYKEKTDARGAVYKYDIKTIETAASVFRDMQKASQDGYVHALYTSFDKIVPEIDRLAGYKNWQIGGNVVDPLTFKADESFNKRGDFEQVEIRYLSLSSDDYTAKFVYNKWQNNYSRFIGGDLDIDLVDNKPITPKNVIIEWHNYGDSGDGQGRIIIDITGEDRVQILRDGQVHEGKWKKDCRTCRTKYYDKKGKPISLNRGQIWIAIAVKVGDRLVSNVELK